MPGAGPRSRRGGPLSSSSTRWRACSSAAGLAQRSGPISSTGSSRWSAERPRRARERRQEERVFDRELYQAFPKHLDGFVTKQLEAVREPDYGTKAFAEWAQALGDPCLALPVERWDESQRRHAQNRWQDAVVET